MPGDGLHVGLAGVGRIGRFHARTLVATAGVRALTIADAEADRAEEVAAEVGARAVPSAEALVEAGIDALVIATPTPGHAPTIRLAAAAGLPAFCEKPVALDLGTMDALLEDVVSAGIMVQIGFQRRFDAGYRAAHEAVASGALGHLFLVRAATHDPFPPTEGYIAVSGGIFRDLHIHDFDAIRFVTGREVVEVYAAGAVLEEAWFARHDDVDTAAAILHLEGGALAILSGSRHDPLGYDVRMEVFGSGDSIAVGVDDRVPIHSVEPAVAPPPGPAYANFMERFEPAFRAELQTFVEAVSGRAASPCPLSEAREALRIALAAGQSLAEGRPVALAEIR